MRGSIDSLLALGEAIPREDRRELLKALAMRLSA